MVTSKCIRLAINNLKVHKNRYARGDVLPGNDCPFCPGFKGTELHLLFLGMAYERIRPDRLKNIEPR